MSVCCLLGEMFATHYMKLGGATVNYLPSFCDFITASSLLKQVKDELIIIMVCFLIQISSGSAEESKHRIIG